MSIGERILVFRKFTVLSSFGPCSQKKILAPNIKTVRSFETSSTVCYSERPETSATLLLYVKNPAFRKGCYVYDSQVFTPRLAKVLQTARANGVIAPHILNLAASWM